MPEEQTFLQQRVLPSFVRACELFGVHPLIVPLLPPDFEHSEYWSSYAKELYPTARELLQQPAVAVS